MNPAPHKIKPLPMPTPEVKAQGLALYEGPVESTLHSKAQKQFTLILWCGISFALFIVWASFASVDQVTRGQGQVIASSKTQVIQAPDGGVIEDLMVKEGMTVKKGQVLARLDANKAAAAFKETESKRVSLTATVARLRAEVLGRSLEFPKDLLAFPDIADAQRTLFQRRKQALSEEVGAMQRSLKLLESELDMNESLLKTGDASKADVIRLQRQATELQATITNRKNKYFQDAQQELAKAEEDLAAVEQASLQRKTSLDYTVLTAPVHGTVKNVKFTTTGAVLRPGDELLTIVPDDENLIIEAKVRPADIAFIRNGLPANVKLDAYDFTVYGGLEGEVVYISADTLTEEQPRQGEPQSYYRVHIRTQGRTFKNKPNEKLKVIPGMTATVEIKTGRNTILKYLLKPVVKTLNESMRER